MADECADGCTDGCIDECVDERTATGGPCWYPINEDNELINSSESKRY